MPTIFYLQRHLQVKTYAVMEWCANETLQLQRLAHEQNGCDTYWSHATDAIPITLAADQPLAVLDVTDPLHPKLARTGSWLEEKKLADERPRVIGDRGEKGSGGDYDEKEELRIRISTTSAIR